MKDDGARGAEITVEDGTLPYCPDCQTKHIAQLLDHIDPRDKEKYERAQWIFQRNLKEIGMTPMQGKDYQQIEELEHKTEDIMTVLRDLRHKIQASPGIDNPLDHEKDVKKERHEHPQLTHAQADLIAYQHEHPEGTENPGPEYHACVKKVARHCKPPKCNPYAVCHVSTGL